VPAKKVELQEIASRLEKPGFWSDQETAQKIIRRLKYVKGLVEPVGQMQEQLQELVLLNELAEEEDNEPTRQEVAELSEELEEGLRRLELRSMLAEPHDQCSAFLSLHAGAGGTESCDWAEMMMRMYLRWAESEGYQTEVIERLPGEEAGIRNATLHVKGEWAFGYLKSEVGVHRLVRISPFDSGGRRHTSFAAVDVAPELEDDLEVDLNENDIEMEFVKSSGPGGQHVNKTSSAVRLRHVPTGITVFCQNERSQHKNRALALKILEAKLYEHERRKQEAQIEQLYDDKGEIAWGSQIRSYVLQPYQMVKDLRTELKKGDAMSVLDGDLMPFMQAYLRFRLEQKTGAADG